MAEATLWISEHDVVSLLNFDEALEALTLGFAAEGRGKALALEKTMLTFDGHSTLHALGAAFTDTGLVGTKTWTHTPGGADPALLLFDMKTGALRAVIEAFALGQLRTAGTAALATSLLSRRDATRMAVIGTGRQSMAQVAAVAHVRPLEEVSAFSPNPVRCAQFAQRVVDELDLPCRAASSPEDAVDGAHVVTLVTRATEAVLSDRMIATGVHVNAVGAIDLERREFEPAILGRCASVVTDSLPQVRSLSSEFREFYGGDSAAWEAVRPLGEVVLAERGPRDPSQVTLFKGMGSGVEDVALGAALLARLGPQDPTVSVQRRGRARIDLARPSSMNNR